MFRERVINRFDDLARAGHVQLRMNHAHSVAQVDPALSDGVRDRFILDADAHLELVPAAAVDERLTLFRDLWKSLTPQ